MKYNICKIQPPGYIHAAAFDEVALVIEGGLRDLGHQVATNENKIDQSARNIIVGCHLLDHRSADVVPKDSIILNTEQLSPEIGSWNQNIMFWLQRYQAWDYSKKNIENIINAGLQSPKYLMLGYHESLKTIMSNPELDIDILFYGSMNARRRAILDQLSEQGLKVKELFGVYGAERNKWIARSKVVLNIHFFNTQIFEIVRCFYLMINSKVIVSEINVETEIDPVYQGGILGLPYKEIVSRCVDLIENRQKQLDQERRALSEIRKYPQASLLEPIL